MSRLFILLAGFCFLAAYAEIEREQEVLVLTVANFDEAIEKYENILVEFYAPWCGHCKKLAPEYATAAKKLKEQGSEVQLAKVDVTENKELGERFGVRGYPTLKFFQSGEPMEYDGPRASDGIINWANKKTGFAAVKLESVDEAKKFVEDNEVAPIGFFKSDDSAQAKAYVDAAKLESDLAYGYTTSADVAAALEAELDNIVLFKKFDDGRNDYDGEYKAKDIKNFISKNALPLFIEFSQEAAQKVFSGPIKQHILLFSTREDENFASYESALTALAKDYQGKVLFVFVDVSKSENSRIAEFFGVSPEDPSSVRLIDLTAQLKKFKPAENEISEKYLKDFIEQYFNGDLKPHLNTEEIPDNWDAQPVKVIVGKNFESVVLDKSKNVFVEFYAPWCGHCKKLAPIWDDLAEKFEDRDDIVVAKMDSTANEVEEVSVQGFPTLKLFKKDSNEIVDYDGERTLDAMVDFLNGLEGGEASGNQKEEL